MGETKTKQIVTEAVFLASDLMTLETGNAVVLHPCAGKAVSKIRFAPFSGKKQGIEFEPIKEKTVSAREFAKLAQKRAAEEAERKKKEAEEKKKVEEAQRAEEEKKKMEEEKKAIEELNRKIANGEFAEEEEERELGYWPKEKKDGNEGYDGYLL